MGVKERPLNVENTDIKQNLKIQSHMLLHLKLRVSSEYLCHMMVI